MDRRDFLRMTGGMGAASLLWSGGVLMRTAQSAASGRVLVVVFQRGGWDGLNVSVPYGEDAYYKLRPTIAVPPPSASAAEAALDLNGFFGFHPALAPLMTLYRQGRVAVLPGVLYPGGTRSHFQGQDIIENANLQPTVNGWLARYLAATPGTVNQRALCLTDGVPRSLAGTLQVPTFSDLASLDLASSKQDRDMLGAMIEARYGAVPQPDHPYAARLHAAGRQLLADLDPLQAIGRRKAENGAAYPSTHFGRQMRQAAGLAKYRPGIELIALNLGGWDTHNGQGGARADGRMSLLLREFAESVAAFFTDLGSDASKVLLLALTEFGRTVAENGSGGTDHGHASTWLAVGGGVQGGVHTGTGWRGLQSGQLLEGRYVAHNTDFRDVYAEVLQRFLGQTDTSAVLPGYAPKPVGFLA
jgi:uncharacterized protein (DUF1501 family)